MPSVSIILPYYRKINYINNTVKSVLNQTYKDFEIILVYDDTQLEDLQTIKKEFQNNPKIKIIVNEKNLGAGISRNKGIENANGEIIAFIDSDDTWHPEKLAKQTNFMRKNNYDFTFCNYEKKISKSKSIEVKSVKEKLYYEDLITSCDIGLSTVQLKKDIIPKDLFPALKTKEDYVAWLKLSKVKIIANNFSENLVIWNKTHQSLSSNFFQKIFDAFRVYNKYEKFNYMKSMFCIIRLSLNSLKRKF